MRIRQKNLFLTLWTLCLMLSAGALAQEKKYLQVHELPPQKFLLLVRYPQSVDCWLRLSGKIVHKSGRGYVKVPVKLRGRLQEHSWRFQILLDTGEVWVIRQVFRDGIFGTSKICQRKAGKGSLTLADMMLRPEDISMSFLYWTFEQEYAQETVSLMKCRVFRLKHPESPEWVKIWISMKYLFPVKVQWYRSAEDTTPYRELLFRGVKELRLPSAPKLKLGVIDSVKIYGDGWKTMLTFHEIEGDIVDEEHPPPKDLFEQILSSTSQTEDNKAGTPQVHQEKEVSKPAKE
ncbi:MAG: hypothetical protein D6820_14070 [Lentisphaerae bacterium]|nr:MAG: hypothetical protein D6820_14070 [Lentisphaerota bacterium]